jgi:hypothetical protein
VLGDEAVCSPRREKGEGRREKGEGRREKGEGTRENVVS